MPAPMVVQDPATGKQYWLVDYSGNTSNPGSSRVGTNVTVGSTTGLGDNGVGVLELANATAPTVPPVGGVVAYAKNGVFTYQNPQGLVNTVAGSQGAISAPVTVANTAAESALQTFSMPANDAVAGAVYHLVGYGVYSNTGTPTLQFTLRLGGVAGTVLAQVPAITTPTTVTNVPFKYEVWLCFLTATTVQAVIDLDFDTASATDAGTVYVATPTAAVTVSLSTTQNLVMDVTWGTASASNTISLLGAFSERIA